MTRKQGIAPLRLKRPQNYVIQYPDDYRPPKPKPQKEKKIQRLPRQKPLKPQRLPRISRPPTKRPVDQKKKFYLPGQKHPTPDEDDGLRIFYESLLAEKPESEIALRYCIQHGLLEKDIAEKIVEHERMQKLKRSVGH